MSNKVKDIDIKNRTNYYSNDIINIKKFDPNNIMKSHTKILLFTIGEFHCDRRTVQ